MKEGDSREEYTVWVLVYIELFCRSETIGVCHVCAILG
jgi:hypothetical protein